MNLELYKQISDNVQKGRVKNVKTLVEQALQEGFAPEDILEYGLISAMESIGISFKNYHIFVPEVILASRAMNAGLEILEPLLIGSSVFLGRAVIGTIEGDYHDIGKNLVAIMLRGMGIETKDLGINVSAETFLREADAFGADIICVSASITTTMPAISSVIKLLEQRELRDKYAVFIGGAPVNESFRQKIGADGYSSNATLCAKMAVEYLKGKKA